MKSIKSVLLLVFLLGSTVTGSAWADRGHWHGHGHWRGGVYIGAPLFWYGAPAVYPYYYQPPLVEVPAPQVYFEQPRNSAPNSWYFCTNPQGYYPYVKQCLSDWIAVPPQPSPAN